MSSSISDALKITDQNFKIHDLSQTENISDVLQFIENLLAESSQTGEDNSFFVADLDEIYKRHIEWKELFPRIEPLYAVKSNYDVNILKLLAHFGIGFDCSSQDEIEKLLKLNIQPNRILFANPCKLISQIKFSKQNGINSFVFDNECELLKIKEHHPDAQCFIRMKVNCLPDKFGADFNTSIRLIQKAIKINLKINGISFYVGFRQENAENIIEAIKAARQIYDHARDKLGYVMNFLDIGGGFPGSLQAKHVLVEMAEKINTALSIYFPSQIFDSYNNEKFKIISELGTYYTCSAYTLCVNIMGKKETQPEKREKICRNDFKFITGYDNEITMNSEDLEKKIDYSKKFVYYINDSSHASFKWFNIKESPPLFMSVYKNILNDEKYFKASIAGATCDSSDFILKNYYMPELNIGQHLIFRNMGSYTKTCAVAFNGIPLPKTIFVSTNLWSLIKDAFIEENKMD